MRALCAFAAPTVNCGKRYKLYSFAPTNATWGIENRTTGFRMKNLGGQGAHIENRLPGGASNPYLVMAGVLAAPGYALYASSKAALNQFIACLRADLKGKPVGTTLVEVAYVVPTEMAANVKANPGMAKASDRFYKLHTLVDTPMDKLTAEVVEAVRKGKRHVRLPRRLAPFAILSEAPRLGVQVALTGVKWSDD